MKQKPPASKAWLTFFGSAPFTSALATVSIGTAILAWAIQHTIGWAGLLAILFVEVALSVVSAWARRDSFDRIGVVPVSLLVFLSWAALSIFWSPYQWATLGSLIYLLAFTLIGVSIALTRDTIQVIRAFGDVLRFVLVGSLALEIVAGILIDSPIPFLGIGGHLANGGPISGLVGNRNELGLLAVIAGISFVIEWRTKSIQRGLAIVSIALAVVTLLFTQSAIALGTAIVAAIVLGALFGVRRVDPSRRRFVQFAVLGLTVIGLVAVWALRTPIIVLLNANGDLNYRLRLWQETWALLNLHPVEGWGWIGQWNTGIAPYTALSEASGRSAGSAANAYLDVWFQLGIVGLVLFVGLIGLAFVRSWLLASRKRSVVFTWPAAVLAALITSSLAESGILTEFAWMTFVLCCVNASQSLSWRTALREPLAQEPL